MSPYDLVQANRHNLEVYAELRCVVCDGDLTFCVSVCQLVLVCPVYDHKLPTHRVLALMISTC